MEEREPKYQKVIDYINENIASGNFKSGDRLMSEKELGEMFGLSRQTVRHATGELVQRHILTRVQGSGTYIGSGANPVRSRKYMRVAVVSTFYESYIFPPTLKGIESVLGEHHYTMQVAFTDNKIRREAEILKNILNDDSVDGLVVEPAKSSLPNPNLHYYREIQSRHIPILFFNAFYPGLDIPCVRIDDRRIAKRATELLIFLGHRKIGAIFKSDDGQGPLRYQGYIEALLGHNLDIEQEPIVWLDTPETMEMADIGSYVLKRLKGCTGVVCYNDNVASQLIEIARLHGVHVPEDMSVVGIDDADIASIGTVPITSFPHPKEKLGRKVADNIIRIIEDSSFDANYLFESEAVIRKSTTEPPSEEQNVFSGIVRSGESENLSS